MSEQLLTVLKLCLLVLLYLFFLRVLRAVWVEINGPRPSSRRAAPVAAGAGAAAAPGTAGTGKAARPGRGRRGAPTTLTVIEPADQKGRRYPLGAEITVGRAPGCGITVDDTYASQIHARVFAQAGQAMVEDLGSTNGTYVNRKKVTAPTVLHRGDRLQVGSTVLEAS